MHALRWAVTFKRWEGLVGGLGAGDDELGDALKASVWSEDDGALSAVLVDEVD